VLAVEEREVKLQLSASPVNLMLEDLRFEDKIGWCDGGNIEKG
jgi:hypothetical protein